MKRHLSASILIACICLPLSASGQTVVPSEPGGSTSNWLQNWNELGGGTGATTLEGGFALPSAGNAIINGSRTLQVDSVINTAANTVLINNTNGGGGTADLEINGGGSLAAETVIVSTNDDAGTLAVQGGTLNVGGGGVQARVNGTVDITSGLSLIHI